MGGGGGLQAGTRWGAAAGAARRREPEKVVMAGPVAAPAECDASRQIGDVVVRAITAEPFHAVGLWYQDFPQMTDEEVRALLADNAPSRLAENSPSPSGGGQGGGS